MIRIIRIAPVASSPIPGTSPVPRTTPIAVVRVSPSPADAKTPARRIPIPVKRVVVIGIIIKRIVVPTIGGIIAKAMKTVNAVSKIEVIALVIVVNNVIHGICIV
jgi:hypothetical protein